MQNSVRMRFCHSKRHLLQNFASQAWRYQVLRLLHLMQCLAIEILHDQIGDSRCLNNGYAKVCNVHHIGMPQPAAGLCFTLKPDQHFPISHVLRSDDFYCNRALGTRMDRLIDTTHTTLAEQLFDQIFVIERAADESVHANLSAYSNEDHCPCSCTHRSPSRT